MRAAITRGGALVVEEVPDPVPQAGQVLVRTLACGICGSDLHALDDPEAFGDVMRRTGGSTHDIREGLVLGHEFAAEIVDYGPGTVRALPTGTVVCGPPIGFGPQGSGIIGYTPAFPGGFGEYMLLSEAFTMPVPNGLDPKTAALTEPFSIAARAVRRAEAAPGSVAVVIGLGPVGLGIVAVLKARGLGPVVAVDFSPRRRAFAERLGADILIDPAVESPYDRWTSLGVIPGMMDRMAAEYRGVRIKDAVIFECVGTPGMLARVVDGAPAGARIVLVGVCLRPDTFDPGVAVGKELDIRGSFGGSPTEYRQTLRDIAEGRIDAGAVITGVTGLDGLAGAIAELGEPDRHAKIIVDPSLDRFVV
ncbi:zinc-binding dehydrogenase [Kitasatospora sp. NBC_01246]|uniref:zinc-binding dehydrogenase n=1 Tax=Kitasatospora sp. NBC_01246 TaxID=2903570 RepID=UPI002E31377F|nr:zinc-binding dehydrogenase [Kitasatospora sp. NBC_01246]